MARSSAMSEDTPCKSTAPGTPPARRLVRRFNVSSAVLCRQGVATLKLRQKGKGHHNVCD